MKKIFTLITALTLSVGLWATSIWSGSQDVHWDNPLTIDASKFASAQAGNKITLSISVNYGTNDPIEFKANGQKLPGTRFSRCHPDWEVYDLFMTQDMVDSCKVYGMDICGDNFTVTDVDLSQGKSASMKEGKTIWTGYSWVDSWSMLEVFKESLTAVKDWDKYNAMRFYSEPPITTAPPITYDLISLFANEEKDGEIAKSDPATDETAGNPLKRYEGYAELDLTQVNPLAIINAVASDRLMIKIDMQQGSAGFNFTDVVLVEQARKEFSFVAGEAADSDPAMFAITWGVDGSSDFVKMSKKEDAIYVGETLSTVDSVVLVRCATGATDIIWDGEGKNVWNQTANYPLSDTMYFGGWVEETNLFILTSEPPKPVEGDQFVDTTSGLKFKVTAVGEANTVKVLANDYKGTSYTIPATVKYKDVDFAVTGIGAEAFFNCESLESITISEGVTTIGAETFYSCSSLVSVNMPASVTTIGESAFCSCALQSIDLPANLITIEHGAFSDCALESITIPEGVTTIGSNAFDSNNSLTSVTFLGNACQNNIGEDAFNSVGSTEHPATLVLLNTWTGSTPDQDGYWYGGHFDYDAPGPTVDATGITVNGRKYGFPVRLVKEVK